VVPDRFTCEECFRRLDDYLDRNLQPWELRLFDEHLLTCEACLAEYEFERGVLDQVVARLSEIRAPKQLLARISTALRALRP
jgi:anti-sigma factor (TIGR02949 family)